MRPSNYELFNNFNRLIHNFNNLKYPYKSNKSKNILIYQNIFFNPLKHNLSFQTN